MVLSLPSAARPTHKGQNAVHYSLTEGGTCYLVLIKCRHWAAFKCAYTLLSVRVAIRDPYCIAYILCAPYSVPGRHEKIRWLLQLWCGCRIRAWKRLGVVPSTQCWSNGRPYY